MSDETATPENDAAAETAGRNTRKVEIGVVTSAKMDKTITIKVERRVQHPIYGKFLRKYTTYKAHDENNDAREGDRVEIMQTRPLSKTKRWRLVKVLVRAQI